MTPMLRRCTRGPAACASVVVVVALVLLATTPSLRADATRKSPAPAESAAASASDPKALEVLGAVLRQWAELIEPANHLGPAHTFTARLTVAGADGLPKEVAGATADLAFQAPDRLRLHAVVKGDTYVLGRDGQALWAHLPGKHFALVGSRDVPRFKADPASVDRTPLPPFSLPVSRLQLAMLPLFVQAQLGEPQTVDGQACHVLKLAPLPKAAQLLNVGGASVELWVRQDDRLPVRVIYADGKRLHVRLDVADATLAAPLPDAAWKLAPAAGDKVETVALAHLTRFLDVAPRVMNATIPTLGPATGRRRLVAAEGKGRLEDVDGTRVLFLKGSPEEMGRQYGTLLKREIREILDHVLYGVGVGSSFAKGNWFFGEIEGAQARLQPFTDPRYTREMDAMATAVGIHPQEARLANFFPELFHCSGFALLNSATKGGRVYHGRVLDYMKGIGLERNAVVIVNQPDDAYAWVNLGYAGFTGTVTAMNEKGISVGEMGGRGYGDWDGKPMAQLLREVMEKAATLDEAVAIMRRGPRTCEYYYVIADGRRRDAVGIAATPTTFEVVRPGEAHALLPRPVKDTVLLSAGQRYDELARRAAAGYGTFDADAARALMTRPVCMTSNIQSVLFAPDTLDFWVANADATNVASHARYTRYNLAELLKSEPPKPAAEARAAR